MRWFSLIILCIAFISCSKEKERIPDDIIPRDTMAILMAEVQYLNTIYENRYIKTSNLQHLAEKHYLELLDSFGLSTAAFDSSLQWYSARQELMEKLFDDALVILTKRQTELEAKIAKPAEKDDNDELERPKTIKVFGRDFPIDEKGNVIRDTTLKNKKP